MTCIFALTEAWYKTAHEKVTSWLSLGSLEKNTPKIWSFLSKGSFRSVLACFKLLNGHAEGSAS